MSDFFGSTGFFTPPSSGGIQPGSGGLPSAISPGPLLPPADLGTTSPGQRFTIDTFA